MATTAAPRKDSIADRALRYIGEHPGCTSPAIARALDVEPNQISTVVGKAFRSKIIDREPTGKRGASYYYTLNASNRVAKTYVNGNGSSLAIAGEETTPRRRRRKGGRKKAHGRKTMAKRKTTTTRKSSHRNHAIVHESRRFNESLRLDELELLSLQEVFESNIEKFSPRQQQIVQNIFGASKSGR